MQQTQYTEAASYQVNSRGGTVADIDEEGALANASALGQLALSQNGVLGRGCDEAKISEEKRLFTEWGPGIQCMKALVRNSTGKAIH